MASPIRLEGARADAYLSVLRGLLAVARPGAHFPDARRLDALLRFLGPAGSSQVYGAVEIDPGSGLPSLRELLRARADRELAEQFLREHAEALPAKAAYYRSLLGAELSPLSELSVRLKAFTGDGARFEVVHERIDAATGCLVRYTLLVEQRGEKRVRLERGDLSAPTERFRREVERCAGADAELALLLISEPEGTRVTDAIRGQIGPLHFAGVPAPPLIEQALEGSPGGFVLHLAYERASVEVPEDRCRDPFSRLYREALGPQAREEVEARREALGYRVAKDRRLICTPALEAPLKQALAKAGARVVVRSA